MRSREMEWTDLGLMPYMRAWALQEELRERRLAGGVADRLLMVEHPAVFTMGRRDCACDIFSPPEVIAAEGIEVVKSNRGGRVTYHGPGQLVGYFICGLEDMGTGIKEFVASVEELCIRLLASFGIEASRDSGHPGVWVGRNKIAAIGMNVQHGVTEHGFALNVDCSLAPYRHILACGIKDRGVTSMAAVSGNPQSMPEVKSRLVETAGLVFSCRMIEAKPAPGEAQAEVKVSSSTCGVGSSAGGSS